MGYSRFLKWRILGFLAQPEKLVEKVLDNEEKLDILIAAIKTHRRRHYLTHGYYCSCEICVAIYDIRED